MQAKVAGTALKKLLSTLSSSKSKSLAKGLPIGYAGRPPVPTKPLANAFAPAANAVAGRASKLNSVLNPYAPPATPPAMQFDKKYAEAVALQPITARKPVVNALRAGNLSTPQSPWYDDFVDKTQISIGNSGEYVKPASKLISNAHAELLGSVAKRLKTRDKVATGLAAATIVPGALGASFALSSQQEGSRAASTLEYLKNLAKRLSGNS